MFKMPNLYFIINCFLLFYLNCTCLPSMFQTCCYCRKKGACVGCNKRSCRKSVHFSCGRKNNFIFQFRGLFPSYCQDHSPTQSLCVSSNLSLPNSCSICLEAIEPVLSYSILKCPCCHASWFHRDCVQRQAHSAGLFFFRCTLCNNQDNFREEMLRMGIFIPERDASWELEANAFSELLEVYQHCDAPICQCNNGRTHSAKLGYFELIRCCLCGSRGTHRKCSELKLDIKDWACSECTGATDGKASLVTSPKVSSRRSWSKRHLSTIHSPISSKRPMTSVTNSSPEVILQTLVTQLGPHSAQVEVSGCQALQAGLNLVRSPDFEPTCSLSVRFSKEQEDMFPKSLQDNEEVAKQYFLKLLVQQIQSSVVFEGPEGCKNLSLDSLALREDLYFDIGCLLALCLVHGALIGFFSPGLFQCLFNFPANCPLSIDHMTPDMQLTHNVRMIAEAETLSDLRDAMISSWQFLELAGCNRLVNRLEEKEEVVEDLVSFTLITRMQLPLQRFREGLQTLGVFKQVQLFPSFYSAVFCEAETPLTAQTLSKFFTIRLSEQQEKLNKETPIVSFWRHFLVECEVGRASISLQDLLLFSTGAEKLPVLGPICPRPSISFFHSASSADDDREEESKEVCLFPRSDPSSYSLLLPVCTSYVAFKSSMEQAVSHHLHLLPAVGERGADQQKRNISNLL
uniref:G2/M-phase specific E3 ubiquitin protein ligase n=1 Tax=Cynoglossus semilaevis TaxID=244447 RepID=A0A3P8VQU2_CYNSE